MTCFNVIGFVSGNLGLGVFARNVVHFLNQLGHEVRVIDIDPGIGRSGYNLTFSRQFVNTADILYEGINLFVMAPPELQHCLLQFAKQIIAGKSLNVALPMWELSIFPRGWTNVFECFDVLAAATPFIGDALETYVPITPVLTAPIPIYFPHSVTPDRNRFALPNDQVLFFTSFEPWSDPQRKNVTNTIRAFMQSGVWQQGSVLVVKVNNAFTPKGRLHKSLVNLRKIAGKQHNIVFITDILDREDLTTLYASMDVFISLHRAEGLGLVQMEAMALGKPVISTGWSGNTAFMNRSNSCLVNYHLIPVTKNKGMYANLMRGTNATWADPDIEMATDWIKTLADDANLRARIGKRAKHDIMHYNKNAQRGSFIAELLAIEQGTVGRHKSSTTKKRCLQSSARTPMQINYLSRLRFRANYLLLKTFRKSFFHN